ncbi:uncharacterized protein LOC118479084, partial [Aplysia californica]|uniref:Uncharacterized protein LOC118479084 n=1 Tax=Aplysia californica TaxID=6500 RepID=A0ABM1W4M2_APLCA
MATVNKREFPEAMFEEVTREYEREYLMTTAGKDPTSEDVKQEVKESMAINPDSSATEIKLSEKDEKENITSLFRYKLTAARFVIVLWNWFATGLIYYGILLNM